MSPSGADGSFLMLLIAILFVECSFSAAISSSSSESSRKPPTLRAACLLDGSSNELRASIDRFLFFGVAACGMDELGGYAMGEEISGMANTGGEDGT